MENDRYFSKIDMSKGYKQIPVGQEKIPMTVFVTVNRHYEFLRMLFGMMISEASLTRAFKMHIRGGRRPIGTTPTWEDHVRILREVFRRLKQANFNAWRTVGQLF
ncbi:retrovirus-related pol polyprotein from transposon 297 [Plakobranchus ocellatus]|uniref:Retrovirus-related pol polyprotein from transposon 297 n=1 Tax=Plakobranchus ocellatus TaxID=259542 RepID=A0AAV3YTM9_9GAST|nr:retrovirus-related pol polyprotein from transposon 297 [Plakobranchus ocellatus]